MDKGIQLTSATFAKPKVQPLQLLKGIANIIKDVGTAATGGLAGLPADVIDTIAAIKLEDKPETIGWKLISRSLVDAMVTLISETGRGFLKEEIETAHLDKDLNKFLEKQEYFVNRTFLKDPESLKLLEDIQPVLDEFLAIFGFNEAERKNLLERLGRYFLSSLIAEWRTNVKYYAVLKTVLETPFDEADERKNEWYAYENYLKSEIQKPVFSESFSLAQIYIPLRAEYKTRNQKDKSSREKMEEPPGHTKAKFTRHAVDIEKHLLKWVKKGDKKDAIRIIRGGPGTGKSSFLKMFTVRLLEEQKRVFFIPLHRLDLEGKLDATVHSFLRYDKFFSHNYDPINDDDKPLILIFDGLDELAMQGKALMELAYSFLLETITSVQNYNQRKLKLQVIVSGRDVIVQGNNFEFQGDGQILKLMPYYLSNQTGSGSDDKNEFIDEDQRDAWWRTYGDLTDKNYQAGLPFELRRSDLDDVTAQPLLNYLVAIGFDLRHDMLYESNNLNKIYDNLFKAVYHRYYSEGGKLQALDRIKEFEFSQLLQEIAVASWHGNGRTASLERIKERFKKTGLIKLLEDFLLDAEKGVVSLLAAFYFRQSVNDHEHEKTFEFTHKSFREFLTAKKIVRHLFEINRAYISSNGGLKLECLREWVDLYGLGEIDSDLVRFIDLELEETKRVNSDSLNDFQLTMIELFEPVIQGDVELKSVMPDVSTYEQAHLRITNSRRAFLVLISRCSNLTGKLTNIKWPHVTSFAELLGRNSWQRASNKSHVSHFCNHLRIDGQLLMFTNLNGANLSYSKLNDANLSECILTNSNLKITNFSNANLTKANLGGADLSGSVLEKAILVGANLKHANLREADMSNADLSNANLFGVDLRGADLRGTNLTNTNFIHARTHHVIWDLGVLSKLKRNGQV